MSRTVTQSDLEFDANHLWHPYSTLPAKYPLYGVESASGVRLTLSDGRTLIDGMASWWSVIHGYSHPLINQALKQQIDAFSHVMFGGLTHRPAIELARRLIEITPEGLDKVFFADSGSVAVEVAIKMAMQYWYSSGERQKTKLLTFRGGYYGDTTGCMSICDPTSGMHHLFTGILPEHHFVPRPECRFSQPLEEAQLIPLQNELERFADRVAAVIIEPIVQGAGGMYFYAPDFLTAVRRLCDQHGVLLIHDEIAIGFGRTGRLFAGEHAGVVPDILCVGKALTGGYMTLAAVLCSKSVCETISDSGPLMHGPTFMANPLACAAGVASMSLLDSGDWQNQVRTIETQLRNWLQPCTAMAAVSEVRVLGAIGVVELKKTINMATVQPWFPELGVWVRPFGRLIYIMPPFIIPEEDLATLCHAICTVVDRL